MGITRLPTALFLSFILLIVSLSLFVRLLKPKQIGAVSSTIVISEIQTAGATTTDEFVELYNISNTPVDITGWKLTRKTTGGEQHALVDSLAGTILPHQYFLIAHTDFDNQSIPADVIYNQDQITGNNTVLLYSDNEVTLVDKVGMGSATDVETDNTSNPEASRSVERKADTSSTKTTMETGGIDEFAGNGYDSDNNSTDFVYRNFSDPQNSSSLAEPPISPTPTIEPTAIPTEEPTPTPTEDITPTPTEEPVPTPTLAEPTPTEEPTPTPTATNTPTPTLEPILTPTPTPTIEPTPTLVPTPTPTPIPTPRILGEIIFPSMTLRCFLKPLWIHTGWFSFYFPRMSCSTY